MRGRHLALPLVLICLLGGACARLQNVVGLPTTPPSPNPTTAIAVSVLADSVYIFDPSNGANNRSGKVRSVAVRSGRLDGRGSVGHGLCPTEPRYSLSEFFAGTRL